MIHSSLDDDKFLIRQAKGACTFRAEFRSDGQLQPTTPPIESSILESTSMKAFVGLKNVSLESLSLWYRGLFWRNCC